MDLITPFDQPLSLAPGQSRPLGFRITSYIASLLSFTFRLVYTIDDLQTPILSNDIKYTFRYTSHLDPQKVTFLHPAGVVSYAILRPPSQKVIRETPVSSSLPIVLGLHGAGLDADTIEVRNMLNDAPDLRAWALFPTGMTAWSGDDWRTYIHS